MAKNIFPLLLLLILANFSCESRKEQSVYSSDTLKIIPITKDTYIHISYLETDDFGKVACNGLIYMNEGEAIVFDTPTDDRASKELIHWIQKEEKKKIKAVVATHFHEDCLGGLAQFHRNGIISYANNKTIELASKNGIEVLPQQGFEHTIDIDIASQHVAAKFLGEGHTCDNVIGYIQSEEVLFGGCLLKSIGANKGYLGDANTKEWSNTIVRIKNNYPRLKIIVPGHGKHGGIELLDYTQELFRKE